ncbi:bifunctional diaminohydroxyphosphoribosylaminopyrimidine deaminase/5-amino-6-(5-phosphoribosylamino)uracil reductase RibD [Synechococcus sp. MIT S9504]|uniref:bifunctional diaminohydroxyphosphoribosylaminopyrimidine deaminase/5-amino-6-(5-phosphoribosylamino)uracil reductase RibD n=1 Tax=Synechococcus sp. MIT S9504 TaxID=1801628 RepID=UPI0007BB69BC|nr:bifunctional diaminohydroxyphosphoribosylaminopyrimidine deaminase/5-amino-6-(5-phosphoribosylamino)uracil reductase RibD [Synechococcus sp. MIT S9504]KZR86542.1 Riboflavin biosynthesis protein RibD [Synechococcus sp. MIT S9504]
MAGQATPEQRWIPWMRRALQLAALAEGRTSPNPLVGAVVLDSEGCLVGEGFHARAGLPHAEPGALKQAGKAARGGTIVVTLEPCCHQGRTPPCTEAILAAGIERVVVALTDPDPRVAGGGLQRLRDAGLEVISGILASEAAYQNRAFVHRVRTGRSWGVLKWAMSLDGRTALPNGASQWISGPSARAWVHQLRARCDAVIVGGGTVRADDPLLTSRGHRSPEPLRVVLSRSLDLPLSAQLWQQAIAPTLVAHAAPEDREMETQVNNLAALQAKGVELQKLDPCEPVHLLRELARRGCNRVLWECGPGLASAALQQGCVQEITAVIAPKLLGGELARTPLGDLGLTAMDQALGLNCEPGLSLGQDLLMQGQVSPFSAPN